MALDRGIYRAFEDVVGVENISEDTAILDSYAWCGLVVAARKPITPEDEKKEGLLR